MQSSVIYNSLCGVRVNMKEGRPLMASGWKNMNRIRDGIYLFTWQKMGFYTQSYKMTWDVNFTVFFYASVEQKININCMEKSSLGILQNNFFLSF